jgi:hypothetical protein
MDYGRLRRVLALAVPVGFGCAGGRVADGARAHPVVQPARSDSTVGQPFRWTGQLKRGQLLELRTVAGHVSASLAEGEVASVEATMHDASRGAGEAPVRIAQDDRGVSILADGHRSGCDEADGQGEREARGAAAVVDLVAHVPAGVGLVVRTVTGAIEAHAIRGPVDARSVEGAVYATFPDGDPSDDVELRTVNGMVQVALGASAAADLHARSLQGDVRVELPLSEASFRPHAVRGTIGRGGHELRLRSVNGAIRVLRGDQQ